MRISDWSSDVCSSDLEIPRREGARADLLLEEIELVAVVRAAVAAEHREPAGVVEFVGEAQPRLPRALERLPVVAGRDIIVDEIGRAPSELQSLMRISYAVFCLKKKQKKTTITTTNNYNYLY